MTTVYVKKIFRKKKVGHFSFLTEGSIPSLLQAKGPSFNTSKLSRTSSSVKRTVLRRRELDFDGKLYYYLLTFWKMEKNESFGFETWKVGSLSVVGFEYWWYEVCEWFEVENEVFLAKVELGQSGDKQGKRRGFGYEQVGGNGVEMRWFGVRKVGEWVLIVQDQSMEERRPLMELENKREKRRKSEKERGWGGVL